MAMRHSYLWCALALFFASQPLRADSTDLVDLLRALFVTDVTLAATGHAADFEGNEAVQQAFVGALSQGILSQLSTFPVGLSSAGFTFTYDPDLGVFSRSAESFGPIYAERSQTLGKGKWNIAFSFQSVDYDSIDDLDLISGQIQTQLTHTDPGADGPTTPFFEGDVIENRAKLDLSTNTLVLVGTYGVTDRFDVGVAIPIVEVELEASSELEIIHLATTAGDGIHIFPDGSEGQVRRASDSATGIGDVLLRGKYRFWGSEQAAWAIGVDLRLPTGNEDDLLGTGEAQAKVFLIGSATIGKFSPHLNFGFTRARDLPDEINYAVGFDVAVSPRVTFAADLVGRTLLDGTKVALQDQTFEFSRVTPPVVETTERPVLVTQEDDIDQLFAAIGFKFNPKGNGVVTINALFSSSDNDGLRDEDAILLLGFDNSF